MIDELTNSESDALVADLSSIYRDLLARSDALAKEEESLRKKREDLAKAFESYKNLAAFTGYHRPSSESIDLVMLEKTTDYSYLSLKAAVKKSLDALGAHLAEFSGVM